MVEISPVFCTLFVQYFSCFGRDENFDFACSSKKFDTVYPITSNLNSSWMHWKCTLFMLIFKFIFASKTEEKSFRFAFGYAQVSMKHKNDILLSLKNFLELHVWQYSKVRGIYVRKPTG